MKKLFGIILVILFSLSFGREASYRTIIVSPVDSYIRKKQLEISAIDNSSDGSVQWKRRHIRRKKLRRPQRGR